MTNEELECTQVKVDTSTETEMELRKLLWLGHGCGLMYLYGDDGEMQCHRCGSDFKRQSPKILLENFLRPNMNNFWKGK